MALSSGDGADMVVYDGAHQMQTIGASRTPVAASASSTTTRTTSSAADHFVNGLVECLWCPGTFFQGPSGLMRHFTLSHSGRAIGQEAVDLVEMLECGVCSESLCGAFRRVGARQCHRCNRSTRLRPPRVGDILPRHPGIPRAIQSPLFQMSL